MAEDYFEGAKLTVEAELVSSGKPYSGPVDVKFLKGSKELKKETVNATDGKFDAPLEYVAPDVEKTEKNYDLSVICTYKKKNKKLLKATIWPKKVKAYFQDQEETKLSHWDFLVKQKGVDDQELSAEDDGKAEITLMARAAYSINVEAPFSIKDDEQVTKGEYRDHIVTVKRNIKAKFVTPDVTKAPYETDSDHSPAVKQWVNRVSANAKDVATHGCDSFGSRIVFTVSADPPEDGRKDDKVYFEVTFGDKNSKRNNPKREVLTTPAVEDLESKSSGKKLTGHVKLKADGGTADFQVELGIAGGDTCEVKIGGTDGVKDAKLKIINWRKMYAQATKLSTSTKPSLASATAGMKPVFIDFEEDTGAAVNLTEGDAPANSVMSGTIFETGGKAKALVVGDHNAGPFKAKMKSKFKTNSLPCAHLIFCDYQYDAKDRVHDVTLTVAPGDEIEFPPESGSNVPGVYEPGGNAGGKAKFLKKDIRDGSDPIKKCKWKSTDDASKNGTVPADHILVDCTKYGNFVHIKMPAAAVAELDDGHSIEVALKVAYADGPYNGWCTNGDLHNVIALGRTDKRICGTIVHECGHAIQQAAETAGSFPGLPAPPHDRHYTGRGHFGPHCAKGLSASKYNGGQDMNTINAGASCTCIMFGSTGARTTDSTEFCDKCEPYVKAVAVVTVSTT